MGSSAAPDSYTLRELRKPVSRTIPRVAVLAGAFSMWLWVGPDIAGVLAALMSTQSGREALHYLGPLAGLAGALMVILVRLAGRLLAGDRSRASGAEMPATPLDPDHARDVARHEAAHAVVATLMGAKVTSAEVRRVGSRNGVVSFDPAEAIDSADAAWRRMVIAVSGNVVDLAHGVRDCGSAQDLVECFTYAAAVISTGDCPVGHQGPLTTDELLRSARLRASVLLEEHHDVVAAVAAALETAGFRPQLLHPRLG